MPKPTTLIKKVLIYHDDEWIPPEDYEIKSLSDIALNISLYF